MKRRLLFIVCSFLICSILMSIQKPIFMLWHHSLYSSCSAADFINVIYHGYVLDLSASGYITIFPFLLALVSVWLPAVFSRRVLLVYYVLISIISGVIFIGNTGLYGYWGFPIDNTVFQYLTTPKEAIASVTPREIILYSLLFTVYVALSIICFKQCIRIVSKEEKSRNYNLTSAFCYTFIVILFGGFDFLAIRGGTSTAVANVSMVSFSQNNILNHAAVNPVFNLFSSLTDDEMDYKSYRFYQEEKVDKIIENLAKEGKRESVLNSNRPNIVLILAESFGRSTIDDTSEGRIVAPFFNEYKKEGIWFENMYASSFRTDRGIVATLSGIPAQTKTSIMKYPALCRFLPSIAAPLKEAGYTTSYIYGGDPNFTNMASYLYHTGWSEVIGQSTMALDAPVAKWGYNDATVARYFTNHTRTLPQPFLTMWQTLSSHEPFDVEDMGFQDAMLNSMAYTDREIHNVIEALRNSELWNNTLIIVIADHAFKYPYNIENSASLRHRIPMLWLGGAIQKPAVIDKVVSQTDLAKTLLHQLEIPTDKRFILSHDIFASDTFGFYVFNNGFGVVEEEGFSVWDCTLQKVVEGDDNAERLEKGKAMLQRTYIELNKLGEFND